MQQEALGPGQHKERKMVIVHVPHPLGGRPLVLDNKILFSFFGYSFGGHEWCGTNWEFIFYVSFDVPDKLRLQQRTRSLVKRMGDLECSEKSRKSGSLARWWDVSFFCGISYLLWIFDISEADSHGHLHIGLKGVEHGTHRQGNHFILQRFTC